MSLDGLPPAHLRVLLDGLPVFEQYGLLLAGGYAFRAHKILHRPSQDLDFATRDDTPLPEIAAKPAVPGPPETRCAGNPLRGMPVAQHGQFAGLDAHVPLVRAVLS